jgi:hypothetical protein
MKTHLKHLASLKRKTCKEIIYLKRKQERMNVALLWKKRQNGFQCIHLKVAASFPQQNKRVKDLLTISSPKQNFLGKT